MIDAQAAFGHHLFKITDRSKWRPLNILVSENVERSLSFACADPTKLFIPLPNLKFLSP